MENYPAQNSSNCFQFYLPWFLVDTFFPTYAGNACNAGNAGMLVTCSLGDKHYITKLYQVWFCWQIPYSFTVLTAPINACLSVFATVST